VKTQATKLAGRLATCLAVLPACASGVLILKYSVDVPYWDQWDIAPFFEKLSHGSLTPADLFAQQNEYRQFFPNLIFVVLGWLTRWNVKYEMLVSFLLACLVSFNVYRLGAWTIADPRRRGLLLLVANLLIFSAIQTENWLFGVQVVYFMPAACVTTGVLVAYSDRLGTGARFLIGLCLSIVSTFSSANGILCWLVLPPVLALARGEGRMAWRRWLPLWAAGLALCAALYVYDYQKPALHPDPSEALARPADALVYLLAFLGGPLAVGRHPLAVATAVGAGVAAAYAYACAYILKFRGAGALVRRLIGWAMIGAYSVGTAAMVTTGRLGFGVDQALTMRYTTFSLYLLVALVYLLPEILDDSLRRGHFAKSGVWLKRLAVAAAVSLILVHALIFVLMIRHGARPARRGLLHAKACLLFINVVADELCLTQKLYPDLRVLRDRAGALDRAGFLRPPLFKSDRVVDFAAAAGACSEAHGSFEDLSAAGDVYVASGRARLPDGGEPADAVILAYGRSEDDQRVFALAGMGVEGDPAVDAGRSARWRKTFPAGGLPAGTFELTAWAFDAAAGKAYKLCGAHTVQGSS